MVELISLRTWWFKRRRPLFKTPVFAKTTQKT